MNIATRTIVGACAALAVLAPTAQTAFATTDAGVAPRAAAKKHYGVVQTFYKAKLEACKSSERNGTVWKVFGRLDTHKVTSGKYSGSLFVMKAGKENPTDTWRSSLTSKGKYSAVGSVVLPRKTGYTISGGIGSTNMGNGGSIKVSKIPTC